MMAVLEKLATALESSVTDEQSKYNLIYGLLLH